MERVLRLQQSIILFTTLLILFRRETKEEAGLDVNLEGIIWIRYSLTSSGYATVRCFFKGNPVEENAGVKDFHDKESHGAEWLTIEEVEGIKDKNEEVMNKILNIPRVAELRESEVKKGPERLRNPAVLNMFKGVQKGTTIFPLSLYHGVDGSEINPEVRSVVSTVEVLILLRNKDTFNIVRKTVTFDQHDLFVFAKQSLVEYFTTKKTFGSSSVGRATLKNVLGLFHEPPHSSSKGEDQAKFIFCYFADVAELSKKSKNTWLSMEDLIEESDAIEMFALNNFNNEVLAPVDYFLRTHDELRIF